MSWNLVDIIEKARLTTGIEADDAFKKRFSIPEIELLLKDEAAFAEIQRKYIVYISRNLGIHEDPSVRLREDLQKRLGQIRELVEFKELEHSLYEDVLINVQAGQGDVRGQIEAIWEKLEDTDLINIRQANSKDILSGQVKVDFSKLSDYIHLVRQELTKHVSKMEQLHQEGHESFEDQEVRNIYEITGKVIDFVISHLPQEDGSRQYLSAQIYHRISPETMYDQDGHKHYQFKKENLDYLREIYKAIQKAFSIDDAIQRNDSVNRIVLAIEEENEKHKSEYTVQRLREYGIELSRADFADMISTPTSKGEMVNRETREGQTFHWELGRAFEDIEAASFDFKLGEILADRPHDELNKILERRLNPKVENIRRLIEEYRNQKNTIELNIDEYLPVKLTPEKREELRDAAHALELARVTRNIDPDQIRATQLPELNSLNSWEDVNNFIAEAKEEVIAALVEQGKSAEDLQTMMDYSPGFNIFTYSNSVFEASEQEKKSSIKNSPETEEDDTSEFVSGTPLEKIRVSLEEMKKIAHRNFSRWLDFSAFRKLQQTIEREMKGQEYSIYEENTDEVGGNGDTRGEQVSQKTKLPKQLPPDEKHLFGALIKKHHKFRQYQEIIKQVSKGQFEKLDDDANLRQVLESLFQDHYSLKVEKLSQIRKLTKVMSLDHPITAMRFHAKHKRPFELGGEYEFHKVKGKPATFRERAVEMARQIKQFVQDGNFAAISRLFDQGEMADQLYMDAVFFPTVSLTEEGRKKIIFDTIVDRRGREETRFSKKIPAELKTQFEGDKFEKHNQKLKKDTELTGLRGGRLVDDAAFQDTFAINDEILETLIKYKDALQFDPDGKVIGVDQSILDELISHVNEGGEVKALGIAAGQPIDQERLKRIAEEYPLVVKRMQQMGATLGLPIGIAEQKGKGALKTSWDGAGKAKDILVGPIEMWWKDVHFRSPMSIYLAIGGIIEHIGEYGKFRAQYGAYDMLQKMFKGTLLGSEFTKLAQQKENEKVGQYQEAFDKYGYDEVIEKLYTATDRFELKAALIEGFEKRGLFSMTDLLDRRFIRNLNKYTQTFNLPTKFTEQQMQEDEDIRKYMLDQLRLGLDDVWGTGTFRDWKNAREGKYKSKIQEAEVDSKTLRNPETHAKFNFIFEKLRTEKGKAELRKQFHPADLLGFIAEDCAQGDMDSWEPYGILQALVIERVISNSDFIRLQSEHANDWPMYSILDLQQAKNSGMVGHWEECKKKGVYHQNEPFFGYFWGSKSLELETVYNNGKWVFDRTAKDFQKNKDANKTVKMPLTGADVQQSQREFQPEFHRKLDNSNCGLATKSPIEQILNVYREDQAGRIPEVRSHDVVARLRGFQFNVADDFDSLQKFEDRKLPPSERQEKFDRLCYRAYQDFTNLFAYVEHFTKHKYMADNKTERKVCLQNQDHSPKTYTRSTLDRSHNDSMKSNFSELILSLKGGHDRMMAEGDPRLTEVFTAKSEREAGRTTEASKFMADLKRMSGIHFKKGVDPVTGLTGTVPTSKFSLDWSPVEHYQEGMQSMLKYIKTIARQKGLTANMANPRYGFSDQNGIKYDKVITFKDTVANM